MITRELAVDSGFGVRRCVYVYPGLVVVFFVSRQVLAPY